MKYSKINFNSINANQDYASITLSGGCIVQIHRDKKVSGNPPFISHDCKLVNKSKSVLDEEEGLDKNGVQEFLNKAEELANEVAGELAAVAEMQREAVS